jgi:hypothetical protein
MMDPETIGNLNDLLRQADEEERVFRSARAARPPQPEPVKECTTLTEKEVDERIMRKLEAFASLLGEEVGQIEAKIRKELREEFQIELGQLRADLTVQRAADRGVLDLADWRHKDVA